MNRTKLLIRILILILFAIGLILGTVLFGLATWGDLEASLFDSATNQRGRMRISCPVMIGNKEVGKVTTTIKNPSDKPIINRVKIRMTEGFVTLYKEQLDIHKLAPGESKKLEWAVLPEDAVYGGRLIMLKVRSRPSYPFIDRQASCGVLVMDVFDLSGSQIFYSGVLLSVIFMGIGIILWRRSAKPFHKRTLAVYRSMIALLIVVIAGLVTSITGSWVLGLFLLVIVILLSGGIIAFFVAS